MQDPLTQCLELMSSYRSMVINRPGYIGSVLHTGVWFTANSSKSCYLYDQVAKVKQVSLLSFRMCVAAYELFPLHPPHLPPPFAPLTPPFCDQVVEGLLSMGPTPSSFKLSRRLTEENIQSDISNPLLVIFYPIGDWWFFLWLCFLEKNQIPSGNQENQVAGEGD